MWGMILCKNITLLEILCNKFFAHNYIGLFIVHKPYKKLGIIQNNKIIEVWFEEKNFYIYVYYVKPVADI